MHKSQVVAFKTGTFFFTIFFDGAAVAGAAGLAAAAAGAGAGLVAAVCGAAVDGFGAAVAGAAAAAVCAGGGAAGRCVGDGGFTDAGAAAGFSGVARTVASGSKGFAAAEGMGFSSTVFTSAADAGVDVVCTAAEEVAAGFSAPRPAFSGVGPEGGGPLFELAMACVSGPEPLETAGTASAFDPRAASGAGSDGSFAETIGIFSRRGF